MGLLPTLLQGGEMISYDRPLVQSARFGCVLDFDVKPLLPEVRAELVFQQIDLFFDLPSLGRASSDILSVFGSVPRPKRRLCRIRKPAIDACGFNRSVQHGRVFGVVRTRGAGVANLGRPRLPGASKKQVWSSVIVYEAVQNSPVCASHDSETDDTAALLSA